MKTTIIIITALLIGMLVNAQKWTQRDSLTMELFEKGLSNEGYMPGKRIIRNPETGVITEVEIPTNCEQEGIDCEKNTCPKRYRKDANGIERKVIEEGVSGGFKPELFYKFENELLSRTFPNLTFYKLEMPHSWGVATQFAARVEDTLYYFQEFNKLLPHSNHNWKDICQSYIYIYFLRKEWANPTKKMNFSFTDYFEHVSENNEKGFPGMEHYILEINMDTIVKKVRFYLKNSKIFDVDPYDGNLDMSDNLTREVQSYGITLTYSNSIDKYTESDGYSYVVVSRNNALTNQKITFSITGLTSGSSYNLKLINSSYSQEVIVSASFQANSSNEAVVEWIPPVSATGIYRIELYTSTSTSYIYRMPDPIILENIKTGQLYTGMNYYLKYCNQFFRNHTGGTGSSNISNYINKVFSAITTSYNFEVSTHSLGTVTDPNNEIDLFINDYKADDVYKFHNTEFTSAGVYPGSSNKYITLQSCFYKETTPFNMTVYPSEESFLLSTLAHEFMHLIQFSYAGNNTIPNQLQWIKEAQPRFIQTVINQADEFNNTGLYLQDVNIYLNGKVDDDIPAIVSSNNQSLYSLAYKYAIFWRFIYEKTGSLSVMKQSMINAFQNYNGYTIDKCMSYMNSALSTSSLSNFENAMKEYAKKLFFIKQPGQWNPNTNYSNANKLITTNIGSLLNISANLLNTYAINLHSLEFSYTGTKRITFECANNNFSVNIFKYVENSSSVITDNYLNLSGGINSIDITLNANEKIAVLVVRTDNTELSGHNQTTWSAYNIKIGQSNLPYADFTANPETVNVGSPVTFTDQSTCSGSCTKTLDFGDGSSLVNITSTVQHTYNSVGTYNAKLTVVNSSGENSKTVQINVDCGQNKSVQSDIFEADYTTITKGLGVNFSPLITGGINYSWVFPNGEPTHVTSNSSNPSVIYNIPGIYDVTLSIQTATICYIQTRNAYITVNDDYSSGNISLNCSYSLTGGDKTITVYADVTGGSGSYNYSFSFSDGSSTQISGSFSENITHTFTNYGNHSYSVYVVDNLDNSSDNCYESISLPNPDPCDDLNTVFAISPATIATGGNFTISNQTSGGTGNYIWCWTFYADTYNGNEPTNDPNFHWYQCEYSSLGHNGIPDYPNYPYEGVYKIELTVNDGLCSESFDTEIEVVQPNMCISNLRILGKQNTNTQYFDYTGSSDCYSFYVEYYNSGSCNASDCPYNTCCWDATNIRWKLNNSIIANVNSCNMDDAGDFGLINSFYCRENILQNVPIGVNTLSVEVYNPYETDPLVSFYATTSIQLIVIDCDYVATALNLPSGLMNGNIFQEPANNYISGSFDINGNILWRYLMQDRNITFTACNEVTLSDGFESNFANEFTATTKPFENCNMAKIANVYVASYCENSETLAERKEKENLLIAYPNPFKDYLTILYTLKEDNTVNISVYDINGKIVSTIINHNKTKGEYSYTYFNQDLPCGTYYLVMQIKDEIKSMKIVRE